MKARPADLLRRLTYRRGVRELAHTLGLGTIFRNCYYRWAAPNRTVRVEVAGVAAVFRVRAPEELRDLEGASFSDLTGWGERHVIELLLDTMRSGGIVYDVGANMGLHSALLAKQTKGRGGVIAFEPDSRAYERLVENLKLNGLDNVRTYRMALGEARAVAKLYRGSRSHDSSLVPGASAGSPAHELVQVSSGDELVTLEHLPLPRAVKIDVEGYEYSVLLGLAETLKDPVCRLLCVEIHPTLLPQGLDSGHVLELIESFGFDRTNVYRRGLQEQAVSRKSP